MTSAPVPLAEQPTPEELEAAREYIDDWFGLGQWPPVHKLEYLVAGFAEQQIEPWRSKLAEQCGKHLATLQRHERAMAALQKIADAREFVCDGVTAGCCYGYATKHIAEKTLLAALGENKNAQR